MHFAVHQPVRYHEYSYVSIAEKVYEKHINWYPIYPNLLLKKKYAISLWTHFLFDANFIHESG